ncbi:MAG: hypothetical protein COB02_10770 [Candidatus Cloacimonadota bacterium]|nr:MAG: hypothetical protein COB02_10770 [Candidatus Cloacimonadota bacterium]
MFCEKTTLLFTGFDDFEAMLNNPSGQLAHFLQDNIKESKSLEIISLNLPVIYDKSFKFLKESIIKFKPNFIIMFGADSRPNSINKNLVRVEKKAQNEDNASIADASNDFRQGSKILSQYAFSEKLKTKVKALPLKKVLETSGVNVKTNTDAGRFVCNNLYFHTLNFITSENLNTEAVFIHIPISFQLKQSLHVFKTTVEHLTKNSLKLK